MPPGTNSRSRKLQEAAASHPERTEKAAPTQAAPQAPPARSRGKLWLWSVMVCIPMWPFLDVSCPFITLLPGGVQKVLLDFHVPGVPAEKKLMSEDAERLPPVIIMHGIRDEQSVLQALREHPYSTVIFKEFFSEDVTAEVLEKFIAITAGKSYDMVNASDLNPLRHLGGLFFSPFNGIADSGMKGTLDGIWDGSMKDVYGGFVPVAEGAMHTLINWTSSSYTMDTSFFGWLTQKVMTTPLHANWPADTLSLQLAGRKQWIIIDPLDMKDVLKKQNAPLYTSWNGGVYYPNLHVDSYLQSKMKIADMYPGDLLFFPPYAAHAVISDAGLNVMTALRFMNPMKAVKIHPWKTIQSIIGFGSNNAWQYLRFHLGLNRYAAHFDTSKRAEFEEGQRYRPWSTPYNDLQLEVILKDDAVATESKHGR